MCSKFVLSDSRLKQYSNLCNFIQGIDNDSDAAMAMVSDNTAKLTSAVNSLPQLLEKKRLIDMHTTIATGKEVEEYSSPLLLHVFQYVLNSLMCMRFFIRHSQCN